MTNHNSKTGALLVGMHGSVASTALVGHAVASADERARLGMITETDLFLDVDLPELSDLEFSGWDICGHSAYDTALELGILPSELVDRHREYLSSLHTYDGVTTEYDHPILKKTRAFSTESLREAVDKLEADIEHFRSSRGLTKVVVVYLGSPTRDCAISEQHRTVTDFGSALLQNSTDLSTGMLYCYAALNAGCAFVDFTPNPTLEAPCFASMAQEAGLPLVGRDGNTGQTLMKTVLAEMLALRNFRLTGWYSTNILGNNDGLILSQDGYNKAKLHDKTSVLQPILGYGDFAHKVAIDFFEPRGDNKESWDSIDFQGFLGLDMGFRINWQGRDSVLAAPLVIDLIRLVSYAMSRGESGLLDYLGIYFKNPIGASERGFFQNWLRLRSHFECNNRKGE